MMGIMARLWTLLLCTMITLSTVGNGVSNFDLISPPEHQCRFWEHWSFSQDSLPPGSAEELVEDAGMVDLEVGHNQIFVI